MSREREEQAIGTADLLAAGDRARVVPVRERTGEPQRDEMHRDEMQREEMHPADMQRTGVTIEPRQDAGREMRQGARDARDASHEVHQQPRQGGMQEELAALFDPDSAARFRSRWTDVQSGFVDDPRLAVQHADELVAEVMQSLAQSFAKQRAGIEAGVGGQEQASTENLRLALRRYRSFFERLLTL